MRSHLVAEHRPNRDLITKTTLFSAVDAPILSTPAVVSSRTGSQAKVAGDEEPPCSLQIQSLITQELFVPEGDSLIFESNHMPDTLMTPHEVLLHNTTKELI